MDNRPVGVYDSGLGGLTVWREIRRQLPEESLVYLGDGKNCPYGARPADEICRLADEAVGRLVGAGCKMVVVACNTATAAAIDFLRRKYRQMPIVGMEPAVKPACLNTRSGVVGVLATARSLDGDLFRVTLTFPRVKADSSEKTEEAVSQENGENQEVIMDAGEKDAH